LHHFKKIYIEITNRCNLACSFCQPSRRLKAFMSPGEFDRILRKITGHTEYIYLHVLGEAMLHPEFELLLDIGSALGFQINLTTNGTLLAVKGKQLLSKPSLRQINISLHSIEEPGRDEGFVRYMDGVLGFIGDAGNPPPLFINLRLWNLPGNASLLHSRILDLLAASFHLPDLASRMCAPGHTVTLAPGIFLSGAHRFIWPHAPSPDLGGRGTCRGLKDHIAILVDGTVVPCCLDAEADIPLGNIHHDSLEGILARPRTAAIRDGFSQRRAVEPLCRRCRFKERFA